MLDSLFGAEEQEFVAYGKFVVREEDDEVGALGQAAVGGRGFVDEEDVDAVALPQIESVQPVSQKTAGQVDFGDAGVVGRYRWRWRVTAGSTLWVPLVKSQ